MASLAYVIRLCADLAQRMPSARLWMRAFILQLASVAVRPTRSRPRSLADVHQWHPLHPGQPRERAVRDAIALRQHPAAVHDYENRTWVVTTKLQKFEDGKLFIAVEPVFGHLPEITPKRAGRQHTIRRHAVPHHPWQAYGCVRRGAAGRCGRWCT